MQRSTKQIIRLIDPNIPEEIKEDLELYLDHRYAINGVLIAMLEGEISMAKLLARDEITKKWVRSEIYDKFRRYLPKGSFGSPEAVDQWCDKSIANKHFDKTS